jgi:amino acid transporter
MALAQEAAVAAPGTTAKPTLQKSMGWFDGFMLALNTPAAIISAIGYSIGVIGGWWAVGLWLGSALIAVLATRIYTEMAAMFPEKSGGIAMYAQEGWGKYSNLVGPLASWGYWVAWASGTAVFAILIAQTLQNEFFASTTSWSLNIGITHLTFVKLVGSAVVLICFIVNISGVRPTVRWAYVSGGLSVLVLLSLTVVPLIAGDVNTSRLHAHLGATGLSGVKIGLVWLYVMFWTVGGVEMAASFTPEFRRDWRDTARALLAIGIFSAVVFGLMPLVVTGVLGEQTLLNNPTTFTINVFHTVYNTGAALPALLLCANFLIVIVACDADSSRTLYGMAKDKLTIRQFLRVNRHNVPSLALIGGVLFNLFLVIFISNSLSIIAAANLGYVLAHAFALTGFLLLRKDRPKWKRPMRLSPIWLAIAAVAAIILFLAAIFGATDYTVTGYGSSKELFIGIGLLLCAYLFFFVRQVVQEKDKVQWRAQPVPKDATGPEDVEKALATSV